MNPTYEIGYSRQQQYNVNRSAKGSALRHWVEPDPDEEGAWRLRCTGSPSTREFKGYIGALTCSKCRQLVRESSDSSASQVG